MADNVQMVATVLVSTPPHKANHEFQGLIGPKSLANAQLIPHKRVGEPFGQALTPVHAAAHNIPHQTEREVTFDEAQRAQQA
jgi:hypothetical protein